MGLDEWFTSDEILGREGLILADTGAHELFLGRDWYPKYGGRSRNQIEPKGLEDDIAQLKAANAWVQSPSVFVTEKVVEEMKGFKVKLRRKSRKLHGHGFIRPSGAREYEVEGVNKARHLFGAMLSEYNRHCEYARRSVVPEVDALHYLPFEMMALAVAKDAGSKIDFSDRYGGVNEKEDWHTDEEIVATALYLSAFGGKQVGIVTTDSDLSRMVKDIAIYAIDLFLKGDCSETFLKRIAENPVRVYYILGANMAELHVDTSHYVKAHRYENLPRGIPRDVNDAVAACMEAVMPELSRS